MATHSYLHTLLYLTAFSQIGVLLRIYLGLVLGGACDSVSWVPCVTAGGVARTGGALFNDLPANVLGSFLMGLFASSDVLAAAHKLRLKRAAPMAALPCDHPWQGHLPLLVGVRTGLCGTLTTFASWVLQMVVMMVGGRPTQGLGTEWVEALAGLLLGTLVAMASLVAGQHAALALYHQLNPGAVQLPNLTAAALEPTDEDLGVEETLNLAMAHKAAAAAAEQAAAAKAAHARAKAAGAQQRAAATSTVIEVLEAAEPLHSPARLLADGFAVATALLLTAISFWLVAATHNNSSSSAFNQQAIWLSVLMAPFGCLLRFHLAYFNEQPWLGTWRWFFLGTFAANMLACCVDFMCHAILVRASLTPLQSSVLMALTTGVGGALSTVSTWVVEVQKLLLGFPLNRHGYAYMGTTLGTAVVLGLLIYGVPVWTAD